MAADRLGSLLVLTEDSGSESHATVVEVVKRMLRLIVADYQTHRLGFEPMDDDAQRAVQGTGWKSKNPKDKAAFVTALRTIATKLGRADGFVLFHIDGDRTWSARASSENVEKFGKVVVEPVRQLLRQRPSAIPEDVEAKLRRLFPIVPFYSIEAWLYQNTAVAFGIAHKRYQGRDAEKFQAWQRDRTLLDDIEKPKEKVCLGSSHNLACAGSGYPAREVADAQRSYAACYELLQRCAELVAVLHATAGREPDDF